MGESTNHPVYYNFFKNKNLAMFFGGFIFISAIFLIFSRLYLYPLFTDFIKNIARENAITVSNHLSSAGFLSMLDSANALTDETSMQLIRDVQRDFNLIKFRISSKDGKILWSTEQKDIGAIHSDFSMNKDLLKDQAHSKIILHKWRSDQGEKKEKEVALTFVPIKTKDQPIMIMEIYHDISSLNLMLKGVLSHLFLFEIIMVGVFLSFITLIFIRINKTIMEKSTTIKKVNRAKQLAETFFDASQSGNILINSQKKIVKINDAALKIFGLTREEVKDKTCPNFICTYDWDQCPLFNYKPSFYRSEQLALSKSGERIPVIKSVAQIVIGSEKYLLESIIDIRERLHSEQKALAAKNRAEQIFEFAPFGIFTADHDHKITAWNQKAKDITGHSESEIKSKQFKDLFYPICEDTCQLWTHKVGETLMDYECAIRKKSGELCFISISAETLIDEDSQMTSMIYSFQDITEKTLQDKEIAKLTTAITHSPSMVMITDDMGLITYINPKFEKVTGYQISELVGKDAQLCWVDESSQNDYSEMWKRLKEGKEWTGQFISQKKDKKYFWTDAAFAPVMDDFENLLHAVGIFEDITERRAAESLLKKQKKAIEKLNATLEARVRHEVEKNREKDLILIQQSRLAAMGEMIGTIAHQWRQPLNALAIIMANIKDASEYDDIDPNYLNQTIHKGNTFIKKMSSTIDDFRNFFKPDKLQEWFNVREVIEESLLIVSESFKHHNIQVRIEGGDNINIYGFPNEFSQVVLIIMNNAKDAYLEREINDGSIEILMPPSDNDSVLITITDHAGGIPDDVLPKIFDPYFSTKEEKNGMGIGLYMSKMIICDHMKGQIQAENKGDGATFTLLLNTVNG